MHTVQFVMRHEVLAELADIWQLQAETDKSASPTRRETLRECADTLHLLVQTTKHARMHYGAPLPAWATEADKMAMAVGDELAARTTPIALNSGDPGRVYTIVLGLLVGQASAVMGATNVVTLLDRLRAAALAVGDGGGQPAARH